MSAANSELAKCCMTHAFEPYYLGVQALDTITGEDPEPAAAAAAAAGSEAGKATNPNVPDFERLRRGVGVLESDTR